MAHIVFAAPPISRFYLLERLRQDLLRRNHRVSLLCLNRSQFTFWSEQFEGAELVQPDRAAGRDGADEELQATISSGGTPQQCLTTARLIEPLRRWFDGARPALTLLHEERSPATRCVQYLAREAGSKVLWTGPGLLPHTMQVDERGLDGDASIHRWTANDYRVVPPDRALLDASLAFTLADCRPQPLPRTEVQVPPLRRRMLDAWSHLRHGQTAEAWQALHGWWDPFLSDRLPPPRQAHIELEPPFVCVLLQDPNDPRVHHDAADAPSAAQFLAHAIRAGWAMDPEAKVVAIMPPDPDGRLRHQLRRGAPQEQVRWLGSQYAAVAAATAAATITVNHPLATAALLAGTPVVHTGRALYGADRITTRCHLDALPAALQQALGAHHGALRRRFLTWILRHGHVWCSPSAPHYNGMLGLVQAIEQRLQDNQQATPRDIPYRHGPVWPLAL